MKSHAVTTQRAYNSFFYLLKLTLVLLLGKCLLSATTVIAQNSTTPPSQNKPPTTTATPPPTTPATKPPATEGGQPNAPATQPQDTTPPAPQTLTVVCVYRAGYESDVTNKNSCVSSERNDWNSAGINDIIVVRVQGLQSLMNRANCDDNGKPITTGCNKQEIALFLDGRKIKGLVPESGAPVDNNNDGQNNVQTNAQKNDIGTLQFHLQRSAESDEEWADLLGAPPFGRNFFYRDTGVSVGLENGYAEAVEFKQFHLIRIREGRFWVCSVILLFVFILLLWLAVRSNILRDIGPSPDGGKLRPYSLARFQMAVWFFLVIASFLYIWLITGATDIITSAVLALIGIGAGTALGSAAIDVSKREDANSQLESLKAEQSTLVSDIAALDAQISATPPPSNLSDLQQTRTTKQTQLNLLNTQIQKLTDQLSPQESHRFLNDILKDENGVSFHRFQMFIWTIVLAILFLYSVWSRLSMPDFSATLLALMGISAGTFIGFKIPEKQA